MSASLDCTSLSTVRSLGGELEYDLWEGQFTFSQPSQLNEASSVVHFFKNEYHALVNQVIYLSAVGRFVLIPFLSFVELKFQVQILQQQITALADTQFSSDDRYSRSKQENAALTAR